MTVSGTSRRARVLWAVTLAALLLSPASILISARAQPKPSEQGYKEWLKEHTFRATVRVEVWCDGKALHLRKVLEGPELRNKLGVERLVVKRR